MYELRTSDGSSLDRLIGADIMYVAYIALLEFGAAGIVAMVPAVTRDPNLFMLLAVAEDGRTFDSDLRLKKLEG